MKLRIDKASCAGNARCAAVSEALFPLNDDGYIAVDTVDVPPGMEELARRGARACPERIIVIEEEWFVLQAGRCGVHPGSTKQGRSASLTDFPGYKGNRVVVSGCLSVMGEVTAKLLILKQGGAG